MVAQGLEKRHTVTLSDGGGRGSIYKEAEVYSRYHENRVRLMLRVAGNPMGMNSQIPAYFSPEDAIAIGRYLIRCGYEMQQTVTWVRLNENNEVDSNLCERHGVISREGSRVHFHDQLSLREFDGLSFEDVMRQAFGEVEVKNARPCLASV